MEFSKVATTAAIACVSLYTVAYFFDVARLAALKRIAVREAERGDLRIN